MTTSIKVLSVSGFCDVLNIRNNNIKSVYSSFFTHYWTVYSAYYSGHQQKHQIIESLEGVHRSPMDSHHKGPCIWKLFPCQYVFMAHRIDRQMWTESLFMGTSHHAGGWSWPDGWPDHHHGDHSCIVLQELMNKFPSTAVGCLSEDIRRGHPDNSIR